MVFAFRFQQTLTNECTDRRSTTIKISSREGVTSVARIFLFNRSPRQNENRFAFLLLETSGRLSLKQHSNICLMFCFRSNVDSNRKFAVAREETFGRRSILERETGVDHRSEKTSTVFGRENRFVFRSMVEDSTRKFASIARPTPVFIVLRRIEKFVGRIFFSLSENFFDSNRSKETNRSSSRSFTMKQSPTAVVPNRNCQSYSNLQSICLDDKSSSNSDSSLQLLDESINDGFFSIFTRQRDRSLVSLRRANTNSRRKIISVSRQARPTRSLDKSNDSSDATDRAGKVRSDQSDRRL